MIRFLSFVLLATVAFVATCIFLAWPSRASAQCGTPYRAPVYSYPTYNNYEIKKKVVVQDVVYTRYIAAIPLLDLPTYSAYYVPAPAQPAPAVMPPAASPAMPPAHEPKPCGDMSKVLKLLEGMDARQQSLDDRLRKLEGGELRPAAPKSAPKSVSKLDIRAVNQQKCAGCHQQGNEAKGGDFVLSDLSGGIVALTDGQLADLQAHVVKGTMPKQNATARGLGITPLTVEEAEAWVEESERQRKRNKAAAKKE